MTTAMATTGTILDAWDALSARVREQLAATAEEEGRMIVRSFGDALAGYLGGGGVTSLQTLHWMLGQTAADAYGVRQDVRERRRVAYHEAGHCVAALQLGIPVLRVSIAPDPVRQTLGYVQLANDAPRRGARTADERLRVEARIIMELAGPLAEEIAGLAKVREEWARHEALAELVALQLRPALSEPELWPFVAWLDARARGLLAQHWPAVTALVDVLLLEAKPIDGARAASVVADALRAPSPLTPQET